MPLVPTKQPYWAKIILVIPGILIIFGGVLAFSYYIEKAPKLAQEKPPEHSTSTNSTISTQKSSKQIESLDLLSPVKPFYGENIKWSDPGNIEVIYRDNEKNKEYALKGQRVTGTATMKSGEWLDFQKHYDLKLISYGWERDSNQAADGPDSSLWGYKKGNQRIIFEWQSAPRGEGWNTFSIISGILSE